VLFAMVGRVEEGLGRWGFEDLRTVVLGGDLVYM